MIIEKNWKDTVKYLKIAVAGTLLASIGSTYTFENAFAAENTGTKVQVTHTVVKKVMWGKTELKLGQIGKVTILEDTPLVKLASDDSLVTVRVMKKGDEYRVYQYKSQHSGLYGVGGSSFVQKDAVKVKYETPSKKKLEEVNGASKPSTPPPIIIEKPTNPVPNPGGGGGETKPVDPPVSVSKAEEVFKNTLGNSYTIIESKGLVKAMSGDNRVFSYVIDDINYFTIDDVTKVSDGYKVMKQLGFSLSEAELKALIKKSDSTDKAVTQGKIYLFANSYEMQIRW